VLITNGYHEDGISLKRSFANNLINFILEPPSRIDFYNTTGALIPCAAIGEPKPNLWWIVEPDGYKVTEIPGLRHLRSDGSLVFPPFKASDYRQDVHAATYRCIAGNNFGIIGSKDVHVTG
ncbi:netrin receptor DSCAM-like protein, partial [Dinothrombium tinctorium]